MTIEEEFFKTFGIEQLPLDCGKCGAMRFTLGQCADTDCKREYPPITSDILLKLICINPLCVEFVRPKNVQELKFLIIDYYIKDLQSYANEDETELFKHQVQSLFKGVKMNNLEKIKSMNIDEMALMFNNGRICPDDFFDTSVLDCKDFNNDCVYCIKQWLQKESE